MKMKLPGMADSALNMTPMIDIVFQLILFFLLNLSFKSVSYRFDAMLPTDRGPSKTFAYVEPQPRLEVSLFRLDEHDPARARTKVKFAGSEWTLPAGATDEQREVVFRGLRDRLAGVRRVTATVLGTIKTPPPTGASVPHADVMKVLDTFIDVDVTDVGFEGAPPPVSRRRP